MFGGAMPSDQSRQLMELVQAYARPIAHPHLPVSHPQPTTPHALALPHNPAYISGNRVNRPGRRLAPSVPTAADRPALLGPGVVRVVADQSGGARGAGRLAGLARRADGLGRAGGHGQVAPGARLGGADRGRDHRGGLHG